MPANDIESEAAHWLIRLEADPSARTRSKFNAWLAADPRNHAVYTRLEETWNRADILKRMRPLDGAVDEQVLDKFGAPAPVPAPARAAPKKNLKKPLLTVAAVLLFVAASTATWISLSRSAWQAYETGVGGLLRIVLADGSTAMLNTDSRIRVRQNSTRREILLDRGEALFTVTHDLQRPFDVTARGTLVQAVGTEFSVQVTNQKRVEVLVTEGKVAITPTHPANAAQTTSSLTAGELASIQADRLQVQKMDDEHLRHKLGWRQGKIWFERATLTEAVAEFNRYNRKQLVIEDQAIAGLFVSGGFEATALDRFIATLGTFGVRALPAPDKIGESAPETIRLVGTGYHN
ncbi:MAG: FecR family protein [Steroidobacteraceae bacterium]